MVVEAEPTAPRIRIRCRSPFSTLSVSPWHRSKRYSTGIASTERRKVMVTPLEPPL